MHTSIRISLLLCLLVPLLGGCFGVDDTLGSNRLRSLQVSAGNISPAFKSTKTSYVVALPDEVNSVILLPTAEDGDATILVDEAPVVSGENSQVIDIVGEESIATITVTPKSGTGTRTYFLTFLKGSALDALEAPVDDADLGTSAIIEDPSDTTDSSVDTTTDNTTDTNDADPTTPDSASGTDNSTSQSDLSSPYFKQIMLLKSSPAAQSAELGQGIAIYGNTLVAGAPGESSASGAAYLFRFNSTGYSQNVKFTAPRYSAGEHFGESIALGSTMMVISAPWNSDVAAGAGAVFTYVLDNGNWTLADTLYPQDGGAGLAFGTALSLSGKHLAVATLRNSAGFGGQVYIYERGNTGWNLMDEISASQFGSIDAYSKNIMLDGDTLAIGSFDSSKDCLSAEGNPGSVSVYTRSGRSWDLNQTLSASDGDNGDRFGYSISIDGSTMVVGAQCEDGPGNAQMSRGAAYVFTKTGSGWGQEQKLSASNGGAYSLFGDKVVASGNTIAVSASYDSSEGAKAAGAVHIYRKINGKWLERQAFTAKEVGAGDRFGWDMAAGGGYLAISAPLEDSTLAGNPADNNTSNAGAVYLFK